VILFVSSSRKRVSSWWRKWSQQAEFGSVASVAPTCLARSRADYGVSPSGLAVNSLTTHAANTKRLDPLQRSTTRLRHRGNTEATILISSHIPTTVDATAMLCRRCCPYRCFPYRYFPDRCFPTMHLCIMSRQHLNNDAFEATRGDPS
jgi:hypothetical protein